MVRSKRPSGSSVRPRAFWRAGVIRAVKADSVPQLQAALRGGGVFWDSHPEMLQPTRQPWTKPAANRSLLALAVLEGARTVTLWLARRIVDFANEGEESAAAVDAAAAAAAAGDSVIPELVHAYYTPWALLDAPPGHGGAFGAIQEAEVAEEVLEEAFVLSIQRGMPDLLNFLRGCVAALGFEVPTYAEVMDHDVDFEAGLHLGTHDDFVRVWDTMYSTWVGLSARRSLVHRGKTVELLLACKRIRLNLPAHVVEEVMETPSVRCPCSCEILNIEEHQCLLCRLRTLRQRQRCFRVLMPPPV